MIAYNKTWFKNLPVHHELDKSSTATLLTGDEIKAVKEKYPVGLYSPNIFARIGLFILTNIIASFAFGLMGMMIASALSSDNYGGLFIFFGLVSYGMLEVIVQTKQHYRSGVDDALMILTVAGIMGGINANDGLSPLGNAIVVFILALYLAIRFADTLMSVAAYLSLLAIAFFVYIKMGAIAKATTPFLIMIVAALVYFLIKSLAKTERWKYYNNCTTIIEVATLICFYLAGNYYVVREASIAMFNLTLNEGQPIPLGWFFWTFTIVVPLIYVLRGIQKKDAVLLRVGLLLIVLLIFTLRNYYYAFPVEGLMTIGGIVLVLLSYFLTRYLKEEKRGFTYLQLDDNLLMDKLNLEALIITETFSGAQPVSTGGTQFGGGSGGGGGASGEF